MEIKDRLIEKYSNDSKHSNYQVLPNSLRFITGDDVIIRTRFEKERLAYILKKINVKNKNILDIGGNTGFFTFELIDSGAKKVDYYEGNRSHAEFVNIAKDYLDLEKKIIVRNSYFQFNEDMETGNRYDVALLLNVLHHLGDDYGNNGIAMDDAKQSMLNQLNSMSHLADVLIFQLGFNWKGDSNAGLFRNGTKREMIKFIQDGVRKNWNILHIGIAERIHGAVLYLDLSEKNVARDDSLGEFLNRPIFIMQTKSSNR